MTDVVDDDFIRRGLFLCLARVFFCLSFLLDQVKEVVQLRCVLSDHGSSLSFVFFRLVCCCCSINLFSKSIILVSRVLDISSSLPSARTTTTKTTTNQQINDREKCRRR